MSKNRFNLPVLMTMPNPTDENDWGGGTGLGGEHGTPMSFSSWLNSQWKADSDHDGDFDEYDYGDWWRTGGAEFTVEVWNELNPTLDYDEYVGN